VAGAADVQQDRGQRPIDRGGAAGVGLAVAGSLPTLNTAAASPASPSGRPTGRPFPPLQDDPVGILALPEGFHYRIVTRTGETALSARSAAGRTIVVCLAQAVAHGQLTQ
jgi:hypothetical protein